MTLKPSKNKIIESNDIQWVLIKQINSGGNGLIWTAYEQSTPSNICVFKFLPETNRKIEFSRLRREFEVHTTLYQSQGKFSVLPIFDYSLNENDFSWVRLPLAKTFDEGIAETAFLQKIQLLIKLCNDIKYLHTNNYCHRDIKPNNLLFLDNVLYLADFGLVTDPQETIGITPHGTRMGNYQTIAPEMRKTGKDLETEDYKKSDIYSLGVTIWMILTQDEHGFDGEYSASQREKLEQILFKEKIILTDIHTIIERCTKTNPSERITLEEIIYILSQVEESLKNYSKYIDGKWNDVCNKLNPYQASKVELTDIQAIYNFLNIFYSFEPDLHHAFFPSGGGLDIHGIQLNENNEFIIINMSGFKTWIKPKRLVYRNFHADISNNYIYLEAQKIPNVENYSQSEITEYTFINTEFITDYKHWEYNLFEEEPLPANSSRITLVHKGSFLFVKNDSWYNKVSATYDGRHSKKFSCFEEFDKYFCESFLSYREVPKANTLPFDFKYERLNISPKVDLLYLTIQEVRTIISGLKFNESDDEFGIIPSGKLLELLLKPDDLQIENKIFLQKYTIEKIREFWCLYNLGKQFGWTIEMNDHFYQQFYENYVSYNWDKLSDKISSRSTSALIDFINRALRNLKHTEFLDNVKSNTILQ
ncbi:protein kinase domain-containing protein [Acinetobacter amyesii]|uniref:protein kinase domain-containing protein n=1 Tax=Acinetobacter amyesii TaxID=2942470 RepID=UPI003F048FD4